MSQRFVHTIELRVDPTTEREVRLRFEVARKIYNALLGEAKRRVDRVRHELERKEHTSLRAQCKDETTACIVSAGCHPNSAEAKAIRKRTYKPYREVEVSLWREHGCSAYALMSHGENYATKLSLSTPRWAPHHAIGATVCVELAKRAWSAAQNYLLNPRITLHFVRCDELTSVESMNKADAIRVVGDEVIWSSGVCKVQACERSEHPRCAGGTIAMQMRLDRTGRDIVEAHARACDIVKSRILRKRIRGRWRYYAQIILAGEPARRPWLQTQPANIGIDLGLSIVAVDTDHASALYAHGAAEAADAAALRLRRVERALNRSRRATNPQCFDGLGRWKKKARMKSMSKRYRALRAKKTELNRLVSQQRESATKTLANHVASLGNKIYAETFDYRKWAREYGYSAKGLAPGAFFAALRRSVERVGGQLVEVPTFIAKLSQACHNCGHYEPRTFARNPLLRRQRCSRCGSDHDGVQADLYQAFLARHVRDEGSIDLSRAQEAWGGARTRLAAASSTVNNAEKLAFGRSSRARDRAASDWRAAASRIGSAQGPQSERSVETRGVETADEGRRAPRWGEPRAGALDQKSS